MDKPVITWVDLQGRFRVTSPAYDHLSRRRGFSDDDAINWTWRKLVTEGRDDTGELYGIDFDHPCHIVTNADMEARIAECADQEYRFVARPDQQGERTAVGGAWKMGADGLPEVDMPIARVIAMDHIKMAREAELERIDSTPEYRAAERAVRRGNPADWGAIEVTKQALRDIPATFDLSIHATPNELHGAWPANLPPRE